MTKEEVIKYIKKSDFWVAEGPALLNMCYPWIVGLITLKKYFKFGFDKVITASTKDYIYQFLDKKTNVKVTEEIISLYKSGELTKKYNLWEGHKKAAMNNFSHLDLLDFRKLSNDKLREEYLKFINLFTRQWTIPLALEGAAIYTEDVVFKRLREENSELDNKTISEYFSTLTQPSKISFNNKERLSFLKVCRGEENLSFHQKNYYWVRNNYLYANPITEEEFLMLVKEELKNKSDNEIGKEMKAINNYEKEIQKKKERIYSEIKISKSLKKEIEAISFIGYWQDERKEMNLRGNYYIARFLNEFSVRTKIPYLLVARLFPGELVGLLNKNNKKLKDIIKERRSRFITTAVFKKGISSFYGKEMEELWKLLLKEEEKEVVALEGTVVSRGGLDSVMGCVNVVLDPSRDKFKEGSILVTSMTRPEFVPLMKKAKAVITNEGGMTCHAAILSREINIPCIVGTKKATKVFKDGDLIELKLNHGKIEKIKQYE